MYIPSLNVARNMWQLQHNYKMNTNYIPANVPGQQCMNMNKNTYKEYGLSWWKDDCFYKYPYLLVSAAYGKDIRNFREKYEIDKDVLFVGDSGGFQAVTQDKDLDALEVLRWMEDNCDVGFILDRPPYEDDGTSFFGNIVDFDKHMETTRQNTELMTTKKRNKHLKLYGVIQGNTYPRINQWYNTMKDFEVDGWSLAPKPSSDIFNIALYGIYAIQNLDTPIHLLAVSGVQTMIIVAYLSKFYNHKITYDSSSYASGCIRKEYLLPYDISLKMSFGTYLAKSHTVKEVPCTCPVCSKIDIQDLWKEGSLSQALISLHNLYWYIMYSKTLGAIVEDDELFSAFIANRCNKKTLKAIEFVDYYMEVGDVEKAVKKYQPYMSNQTEHIQRRFRI